MGKKIASNRTVSKLSAATSLTDSPHLQSAKGSSILLCAFLPPQFFQSLFVSVIHEIGSQHVRVHDTRSERVLCNHPTSSTASITCLDWGRYRSDSRDEYLEPSRKKRKIYTSLENQEAQEGGGVVVAYGTNESKIHFLSPAEGKVIVTLQGGHTLGINDFKFSLADDCQSGWSLGGDGNLVQWNLQKVVNIRYFGFAFGELKVQLSLCRTISITGAFATTLLPTGTQIFYASHVVHGIDLGDSDQKVEFGASTTNVHTLVLSALEASAGSPKLLTAAHASPQMQVFDVSSAEILVTLVAQNDIKSLSYLPGAYIDNDHGSRRPAEFLAAVTVDNKVEIFIDPFNSASSLKAKHQQNLSSENKARIKRSSAVVQLHRHTDVRALVPILKVCLKGNTLSIAWVEHGMNVGFEEIQCVEESSGEVCLSGLISKSVLESGSVTNREINSTHHVEGQKRTNIDESHAVVLHGGEAEQRQQPDRQIEVVDISSAAEDSNSSDDEMDRSQLTLQPLLNGQHDADNGMKNGISEANVDIDNHEALSFGEMIAANSPETVEVTAALSNSKNQALIPLSDQNSKPSTNLSLATLLRQALGTNDNILLERCLHVVDTNMIRATVERLNPTLATALLQKLADRLHSRPGRAGTLLVWVQWTLIAHGGYLGTQTAIVKKLSTLYRVVRDRANTLQSLLSLKGKLDMLEAQMNMRRGKQQRLGNRMMEDRNNERVTIYVEGQNEISSEDEAAYKNLDPDSEALGFDGGASVDLVDNTPGVEHTSDDFESDTREFEEESSIGETDLFDQEASESGPETEESPDEEVDYDDVDSIDEQERGDAEESPRKVKLKSGLVNGNGSKRA